MPETTDNTLGLPEELEDELSGLIDKLYGGDEDDSEVSDTPDGEAGKDDVKAEAETDGDDAHPEGDGETDDGDVEASDEPEPDVEVEADEPDGDDEGEGDVEEAGDPPASTFTVKVNGVEREVTSDELIVSYQKASAADEKFRAAAEKEKEVAGYVEFAEGFSQAMKDNPADLLANYANLDDVDPNKVIVAIVEHAAASGRLHPELAERLGVDDKVVADARAKIAETRAEAAERQLQERNTEQADEWGYTPTQYQEIIPEILSTAGLGDASVDDQRAFVQELARFRVENNIANPYLAFAQLQSSRSATSAAEAAAAATATAVSTVTKKAKAKRIPAASASSGQRATEPQVSSGPVFDHHEAAQRAYAELFGDQ
jgi:hypothetical protein